MNDTIEACLGILIFSTPFIGVFYLIKYFA